MWETGSTKVDCDPKDPNFPTHDVDMTAFEYVWNVVGGSGSGRSGVSGHTGPIGIVVFPGSGSTKILAKHFVINVSQMADPTKAKEELWNYLHNNKITTNITITGTKQDLKNAKIRESNSSKTSKAKKKIAGFFYNELMVLKKLGFSVTVVVVGLKTNKPKTTIRI